MLSLLELEYSNSTRILSGFNAQNPVMSKGWARKGFAGIFEKKSNDLLFGCDKAVELRTLVAPNSARSLYDLLQRAQFYFDHVRLKSAYWNRLVENLQDTLKHFGLPDTNWKKPNLEGDIWRRYADNFDEISEYFLTTYCENEF